jgi:hypothetical protein
MSKYLGILGIGELAACPGIDDVEIERLHQPGPRVGRDRRDGNPSSVRALVLIDPRTARLAP